ncbi:MAG: glucose-6-phosphate isomerase [Opitutales bacterium]|nr:glucose-6-phosphate isomerase [Opitutales bacterium]
MTWETFQSYFLDLSPLPLSLDTSKVFFQCSFFESMQPKIAQALAQMADLEAGSIANPDEHRQVGHYWLRNFNLAPNEPIRRLLQENKQKRKTFVQSIRNGTIQSPQGPFQNLLCIGIGGSALGPQLLTDALVDGANGLQTFFLDNTDPDGVARLRNRLDPHWDRTLVLVTSKSGSTPEPRNGLMEIRAIFQEQRLHFPSHAVAITCEGSPLDEVAKGEHWLASFPMWDWVGGRTSLLSHVGLLPAALQGIDTDALLQGAAAMDTLTRRTYTFQNPALMMALAWYAGTDGCGKRNLVFLPYKDTLSLFPKYLQQLIMESLGKKEDVSGRIVHQGLTVYGNKGSTDQHAYVQQLRDGLNDALVTFLEVQAATHPSSVHVESDLTSNDFLEGFFLGTRAALTEVQRPSITITLSQVNAYTLGALVALFERTVGFYATFIGVNAYHQPGVEAGKKAAQRYLHLQQQLLTYLRTHREQSFTAEDLAHALLLPEQTEEIFKLLEYLTANQRLTRNNASSLTQRTYQIHCEGDVA